MIFFLKVICDNYALLLCPLVEGGLLFTQPSLVAGAGLIDANQETIMNRQIKFRGKRRNNGEWVYGGIYFPFPNFAFIVDGRASILKHCSTPQESNYRTVVSVDPATVGQFTGIVLLDCPPEKVELYADDIIEDERGHKYRIFAVEGGFVVNPNNKLDGLTDESLASPQTQNFIRSQCKKIGNIHDNKDLLNFILERRKNEGNSNGQKRFSSY
ncbi:MAG: YopX family protein [Phycisphaerae bacterium]|nr:YopX family protein [Phycisphaerae bacterium]